MKRFYAVLAVVWTLLLGGILVELHQLNHQSDTNRSAAYQFLQGVNHALADMNKPETESERKARIQATQQRMAKDFEYAITAPTPSGERSRASRRTGQPSDPHRSPETQTPPGQSPR